MDSKNRQWSKWENPLCNGSCIFYIKTDTRTNKQRSLLTCVNTVYASTCKLLSEGLVPNLLPPLTWPQNSSHLACVLPIIHKRNTLVCFPEVLKVLQCRIFVNSRVSLFSQKQMFVDVFCRSSKSLFFPSENLLLFFRAGCNPVETSGDDSGRISDADHMWVIILRLAFPGQIGLCIFSDSPMHIHGTRLWWHLGPMKVFPVFVFQFKGLDRKRRWWCDAGSTLGQSSLSSPA